MRRRELQTIQLKLSELKEYELAKMERLRSRQQPPLTPRTPSPTSDSDCPPMASSSVPAVLLSSGGTDPEEDLKATLTPKSSSSSA